MRKIGKLLKESIGRDEVLRAARANLVLKSWAQIVGSTLAQKSSPDRFDHGTVWVSVTGSAWAQELRMIKAAILQRLNGKAGEEGLFTDLRFGVREVRPLEEEEQAQPIVAQNFEDLSIREIAERRLADWPDEESTRA